MHDDGSVTQVVMRVMLLGCPCCGCESIHAGHTSAQSQGVKCNGCGLEMSRWYPDENPKIKNPVKYLKHSGYDVSRLDALPPGRVWVLAVQVHTLRKAVKAWNRRT